MSKQLKSAEVAKYLAKHPDFFKQHLELLESMHLPHPCGDAVSLVSRQLDLFRHRHQAMEEQLTTLVDIARDNDHSVNQMHELTLAVIEVDSIDAALKNLNMVLSECFLTDFFVVKIITEQKYKTNLSNLFMLPDASELKLFEKELSSNQASCGEPTLEQAQFLFASNALKVKSCAIIPMAFNEIEGIIAIGSRDKDRFHYSMGNLFLTQISEILGTRFAALLEKDE